MIVIDYRQLLDKIDNPPYTLYSAGDRAAWLDECITTAHAFDAEPVKYGRWVRKHNSFPQRYFCTECGGGDVGRFAFCHHCGARMRMDGGGE